MQIRTKPLRYELGAPKGKNKKGLNKPPIKCLPSTSSSLTTSVLSAKGYPNRTLTPKAQEQKAPLLTTKLFLYSAVTVYLTLATLQLT